MTLRSFREVMSDQDVELYSQYFGEVQPEQLVEVAENQGLTLEEVVRNVVEDSQVFLALDFEYQMDALVGTLVDLLEEYFEGNH